MAVLATPHIKPIEGTPGFGKTVLMPGDPKRSKFIADNYLENPILVNDVRGVQGYTGTYKGVKVSVMASGMGMPSIGIYSYELFKVFDVQNIIRVGSAGSMLESVKVRDIAIGMSACTDSEFPNHYGPHGFIAPTADFDVLRLCVENAEKMGARYHVGPLYSSDVFYTEAYNSMDWAKMGCMAVEMEAAALYSNAMRLGKRALAICTISDALYPPYEALDADERQNSFREMMVLALETALSLEDLPHLETRA